jgi:hypothetical protein
MDVLESGSMVAEPASEYNVIRKDIMKLREELDSLKEKLKDI